MAEQQTWHCENHVAVLGGGFNGGLYSAIKRCADFALALVLLILVLPLLLLVALLIKLDSRGPVIFCQERVGARRNRLGNQTIWIVQNFTIYKFRSMVQNADSCVHEAHVRDFVEGRIRPDEENGGNVKLTNDPRVTRIGRFLRQFSLDELPQLANVLKGDMSLVGPRPVPPYEVAAYEVAGYRDGHHQRLAALPGITGLWQVEGRGRVSFEEMMRMDMEYVRKASLWLDVKILFLTFPAVLSRKGAK